MCSRTCICTARGVLWMSEFWFTVRFLCSIVCMRLNLAMQTTLNFTTSKKWQHAKSLQQTLKLHEEEL